MRRWFVLSHLLALAVAAGAPAAGPEDGGRWWTALLGRGECDVKSDIVYARPGERKLLLDAYVPKASGPFPAVLVVHGGAWASGNRRQLSGIARALAVAGYAAFAIDYRLAPKDRFPAQIEDCRSAVRWIVDNAGKYKVDAGRLGAIGYSAGGHLVAMLAAQGVEQKTPKKTRTIRLKAAAAGGAPCDFRSLPLDANYLAYWLGGTRRQKPGLYVEASPAAFVGPSASPVFFYHGEDDLIVRPASARAMAAALRKIKVEAEFHLVKGAGHIGAAVNRDALARAVRFLGKHLKPDETDTGEGKGPSK
ncbi:MAG: alpha/beta hydrolase, partial [Phycisphaerae bacterium]